MNAVSGKKVLYLNNSMGMGGIETMILDFARVAQKGLFESYVGVLEAGGSLEGQARNLGCVLYHFQKRKGFDPVVALRLLRVCRKEGIHVVHSHNFASWLYAGFAVALGAGVRHIHTEHSGVEASARRFFLERRLATRTNEVVAVSNDVKQYMVNQVGIPATKVRVVYNGVNLERFTFDCNARSRIRSELSIGEADIVGGLVARLAPVKGHDFLFEAMREVKDNAPSFRLVIVGNGNLRSELEEKTKTLGLSDCVFFLGERGDIPQVMSAMDLYVLPSKNEGMNLTLLEAMSIGLPVVARKVGGNSEIVCHEESGLLVSAHDAKGLAQGLLRLARNKAERERMGKAGRKRVMNNFDQAITINTYLTLYSGGNGL